MNLREIRVKTYQEPGEKHVEITVESVTGDAIDDGALPVTDVWGAAVDVAGILARVGLQAQRAIESWRDRHDCRYWRNQDGIPDSCSVGGDFDAILAPGQDLGSNPALWIYVPPEVVGDWLELIGGWLTKVSDDLTDLANHQETLPIDETPKSPNLRSVS